MRKNINLNYVKNQEQHMLVNTKSNTLIAVCHLMKTYYSQSNVMGDPFHERKIKG